MDENKRLVVELTRLDRPGTPAGAVAVLLEMHPGTVKRTQNGVTLEPGEYITKPARYDEGDLSKEHEYKRGFKAFTVVRENKLGEEIHEKEWREDIVIRQPITELVDDKRHRLQGYVGLMAAGVPLGRLVETRIKLPDGSDKVNTRWQRINHAHKDVRAVVGLVVDIDLHNYTSKAEMREQVQRDTAALWYMWQQGDSCLPMPAIEDSGRGIHLWWVFNQAIPYEMGTDSARWYTTLANAVKLEVGNIIKALPYKVDIDSQATAAYRVYNLPGSWNDATDTMRQIINDDWQTVDVDEFCSAAGVPAPGEPLQPPISVAAQPEKVSESVPKRCYNPSLSEDKPAVDGTAALKPVPAVLDSPEPKRPAGKKVYLQNDKTRLYGANQRVQQLVAWASLRNFKIMGYRNEWLANVVNMLYSGGGVTVTVEMLQEYNKMLAVPLDERELKAIIKTMCKPIYKARKNSTIAKNLHMTDEEQAAIDFHANRNKTRDNERAARKAEKAAKYAQIPTLKADGNTQKEVAAILGVSLRAVQQRWK